MLAFGFRLGSSNQTCTALGRQATALRRATRAVAQRGGGPPPAEASPAAPEEVQIPCRSVDSTA